MNRRGRDQRAKEIVGHHSAVITLGDGSNLLAVGDATCEADIGSHVLWAATLEQFAELPDRRQSLAIADGHLGTPRQVGLSLNRVDLDRVFEEIEIEWSQCLTQRAGCHRCEFAVDLDYEIEIRPPTFASRGGQLDGILHHLVDPCIDVMDWIELEGREAFFRGGAGGIDHGIGRATTTQQVQANLVATSSAEQFPDRCLEVFALDVPQSDIDGTDRTGQRRSAEGRHAIQMLPVVLDPQGVLTDEIPLEGFHDLVDGFWIPPTRGLTNTSESAVRCETDDIPSTDEERLDPFDLHELFAPPRRLVDVSSRYIIGPLRATPATDPQTGYHDIF